MHTHTRRQAACVCMQHSSITQTLWGNFKGTNNNGLCDLNEELGEENERGQKGEREDTA